MSTTQEQRPTPETDEAARKGAYFVPGDFSSTCGKQIVHIDFARKLERERDGLKEYAERCKQGCIKLSFAIGQIDYVCGEPNDMEVSDYCLHQNEEAVVERVKTKIAGLERERDEARRGRRCQAARFLARNATRRLRRLRLCGRLWRRRWPFTRPSLPTA